MKEKFEITMPNYKAIAQVLTTVARDTNFETGADEIHYALLDAKSKGYQEGFKAGFEEARCMMQKEYL